MKIVRNIPFGFQLFNSFRRLNPYIPKIEKAKAEGDRDLERQLIGEAMYSWMQDLPKRVNVEFEIIGAENIPERDGILFMANHQGYADIPAVMAAAPHKQLGFIAKDGVKKVPMLGPWVDRIRGFYLERGNARAALKKMAEGSELLQQGYNLVIYPEGTRSQCHQMGEFKPGSFKLATKAKAPVIPITIDGTYKCFEEQGYLVPGKVRVIVHPMVETAGKSRKELAELERQIEATVRGGLKTLEGGTEND